ARGVAAGLVQLGAHLVVQVVRVGELMRLVDVALQLGQGGAGGRGFAGQLLERAVGHFVGDDGDDVALVLVGGGEAVRKRVTGNGEAAGKVADIEAPDHGGHEHGVFGAGGGFERAGEVG